MKISELWPTPVGMDIIPVDLKWLNYCKSVKIERMTNNNGNKSVDNNILNNEELFDLKNLIIKKTNDYLYDHIQIEKNVKFKMTNSWVIEHMPNDFSHSHIHTNSLISGVYYLDVNDDSGDLVISKVNQNPENVFPAMWMWYYSNDNKFNTNTFKFKLKSGNIILFPSHLSHSVEQNLSNKNRYCIAFDFFPYGSFGAKEYELTIK